MEAKGVGNRKIPLLLLYVVLSGVFAILFWWFNLRHLFPGNWPGRRGWFLDGFKFLPFLIVSSWVAILLLLRVRQRSIAVLFVISISLPVLFAGVVLDGKYRFTWEKYRYEQAIETGTKFGDQYEEDLNGRKLTYWRWISWGIDDALGVIYDPSDKLNIEDDRMAFRESSQGVLFRIRKMGPHWYLVDHS
jgi:hypothetical protein